MCIDKKAILDLIRKDNISFIRLMFCDLLGNIKCVDIPINKINNVLDNNITFDGSSIKGFKTITSSDLYLHPDINSLLIIKNVDDTSFNIIQFNCDIFINEHQVFESDPRFILKKQISKMKNNGYDDFQIGFEGEFYLLDEDNITPIDRNTYFDISLNSNFEKCRLEIACVLIELGFDVEVLHHEVGFSQLEIIFKHCFALQACDLLLTFKTIVKSIAKKYHFKASFMPKIYSSLPGNGMHTNCSLWRENKNMFYAPKNNDISNTCIYFINGILKIANELIVITNPSINSYKRLNNGFEAPRNICYGREDRSSLIRIPSARQNKTRIEVRNVDATSNPYLVAAILLASGLSGINNELNEKNFNSKNIGKTTITCLPSNLYVALEYAKNSKLLKEVLGINTFKKYLSLLTNEWNEYCAHISNWELNKYL